MITNKVPQPTTHPPKKEAVFLKQTALLNV